MSTWHELLKIMTDADVIGIISSVILITGLGYVLTAMHIFSSQFENEISRLVLVVSVPALSFVSFMQPMNPKEIQQGLMLIILGFVLYIILLVISPFVYWCVHDTDQRRVLGIITTFGSTTVFGIPIAGAIYGSQGVIYASLFNMAYRILLYTYVYIRMAKQQITIHQILKVLANPIVLATFLGLFCWLYQPLAPKVIVGKHMITFYRIDITAPWLYQPLKYLASLAAPLSWLLIGCTMGAQRSLKASLIDPLTWYYGIQKSFLVPAICLGATLTGRIIGLDSISLTGIASITILMSSPTSTIPVIYSLNYHQYPLMTAKCSIVSNITSIIALPFWLIILKMI